jgi:hypothetical protein
VRNREPRSSRWAPPAVAELDIGCGVSVVLQRQHERKSRRAGATETFSVSVDPETKLALRALADAEFQGNLSALVTDLAEEARRRMAAGAFLDRQGIAKITKPEADALQAEIDRELRATRRRRKRKVA